MQYFFVQVTLSYEGYEWGCLDLIEAKDQQAARKQAEANDYTHGDGVEMQQVEGVDEIPFEHYQILKQYI